MKTLQLTLIVVRQLKVFCAYTIDLMNKETKEGLDIDFLIQESDIVL